MKVAYVETFAGISGDMLLGALIDAGAPVAPLEQTLDSFGLGLELRVERVLRCGIAATKVHIRNAAGVVEPIPVTVSQNGHQQPEPPGQGPAFSPGAGHHHQFGQHAPHHHGRALADILQLVQNVPISPEVQALAVAAFRALGEAEAKVHGVSVDQVHFHEVGALDAIADIVLTAAAACALQVDQWFCSPLNVGGGMVHCAHGVYPVPAPAVAELLRPAPTYSTNIQTELVTPTGAALLIALNVEFVSIQPKLRLNTIGYGAGSRDPADFANVLRVRLGEQPSASTSAPEELITVLETALDDLSPQVLGYVADKLMAAGALDVMCTPVLMKKGRPGTLLTVLADQNSVSDLENLIFRETTTLGIRRREEQRSVLPRELVRVSTVWGPVRVKIATLGDAVCNVAPEFEDCRRLAETCGVPLKQIQEAAVEAYRGSHS